MRSSSRSHYSRVSQQPVPIVAVKSSRNGAGGGGGSVPASSQYYYYGGSASSPNAAGLVMLPAVVARGSRHSHRRDSICSVGSLGMKNVQYSSNCMM